MAVTAETTPRTIDINSAVETQQPYKEMSFLPHEDRFKWDKSKGRNVVLIGQAEFGADAFNMAIEEGHHVSQVYGVGGKDDLLEKAVDAETEYLNFGDTKIEPPKFFDLKTSINEHNVGKTVNRIADVKDALIVMAFVEEFLPEEVLEAADEVVEYHPSPLPLDAGSSSLPFGIAKGRNETALSLLRPGKGKVDTGPLLALKPSGDQKEPTLLQPKLVITDWDTVFTLNAVAGKAGISLLRDGLRAISLGESEWVDQDLSQRTFDRKATKPTAELNHAAPAKEVYDKARAFPHISPFVRVSADNLGDDAISRKWKETLSGYDNPIINVGGTVSLRDDVFIDAKPGDLVQITKGGATFAADGGSVMYSDLQMSALKKDAKGRDIEDRAARGPKMDALKFSKETGLHVGVAAKIPQK